MSKKLIKKAKGYDNQFQIIYYDDFGNIESAMISDLENLEAETWKKHQAKYDRGVWITI